MTSGLPPQQQSSLGSDNRTKDDTAVSHGDGNQSNVRTSKQQVLDVAAAAAVVAAAADLNKGNAALNNSNSNFDFTTFNTASLSARSSHPTTDNATSPLPRIDTSSPQPLTPQKLVDSPTRFFPSPTSGSGSGGRGGSNNNPLRIQTDLLNLNDTPPRSDSLDSNISRANRKRHSGHSMQRQTSSSSLKPVGRTPSLRAALRGGATHSAASSVVSSPVISAMGDVTPLPSPLMSSDSPGPWKRLGRRSSNEPQHLIPPAMNSVLVTSSGESVASALKYQHRRIAYEGYLTSANEGDGDAQELHPHGRNRSISEYVPDPLQIPKRMVTVSASHAKPGPDGVEHVGEPHMRREPNLSEARGLTSLEKPPTPPPSESSLIDSPTPDTKTRAISSSRREFFEARGYRDGKKRRWQALKTLGQGTFSRVMLATSQIDSSDAADDSSLAHVHSKYDRRSLVAIKVCEHGPKGGASEERIEMSLKRELEIMQSIHHPSLVHLKAWSVEATRALLVLSYCPGGDLFDVASTHRELLTPSLLKRIFAEIVGAVSYLHERHIVHRDIKLENVLVNIPPAELADPSIDWTTYPYSVITLTDLGLSRRVADDEKLETRCGSDDYAAPEVIMGQPYDGRAIDAWSLGVLLYALLEGRLPFDPSPGASDAHRMRSRTSHRIARVEWRWIEYAGEDGDHEGDEARFEKCGLLGAMRIAEGLLKRARSRWTVAQVAAHEWVQAAMRLEDCGGLRFRDEEEGEEIA